MAPWRAWTLAFSGFKLGTRRISIRVIIFLVGIQAIVVMVVVREIMARIVKQFEFALHRPLMHCKEMQRLCRTVGSHCWRLPCDSVCGLTAVAQL